MTAAASTPQGRHILVVVTSLDRRGAELEGVSLATELARRGAVATAVALAPGTISPPLELEVLGPAPLAPTTLRALRRRATHVDVVVAHGSTTLPACAVALGGGGTPFVYRNIGDPRAWARGRARRVRTAAMLRRAHHVMALSARSAEALRALYWIAPRAISVAPNARDATTFIPGTSTERHAARSALDVGPDQPTVCFIGALTPEKRPLLAVEAVAALPHVALVIAGDGPCRAEVEAAAGLSRGVVRVLGAVSDVRPVLHASDLVVSTSRTEGMPGALVEAALCGVPVVATDVGFVADAFGPGGVLVPPGASADEVREGVRSALEARARLGRLARQHAVERLSWDVVAPIWLEVLDAVSPGRRVASHYR